MNETKNKKSICRSTSFNNKSLSSYLWFLTSYCDSSNHTLSATIICLIRILFHNIEFRSVRNSDCLI